MTSDLRVLVVEADVVTANAIAGALRARGHRVCVAASAAAAVELPRPDVLVLDAELEERSGFDLLADLERGGRAPVAAVLFGQQSLDACRRAFRRGASDFLSKPFRMEELVRAVEAEVRPPRAAFRRRYPARSGSVDRAARDLAAFALRNAIGPSCRARIAGATGELVENAIRHAYPGGAGEVEVSATVDARELAVEVCDEGVGFDVPSAFADNTGSALHDGLARVACLCESFAIDSRPGRGTRARLTFGAYRADFADGPLVDLSELDFLTPDAAREVLRALEAEDCGGLLQLSPALAVVIGRLLAGPDPRKVLQPALWS